MQLLSVLVIGLGVGWLAGLSVSPVIATVLASLVGVAGGIAAGVRSVSRDADAGTGPSRAAQVDARPAAVLVLGIALAAPIGIVTRTHALLEPADARRVGAPPAAPARQGVLFGVTVEQCEKLRAMADFPNERAYRDLLATAGDWGRLLEAEIEDTSRLKAIVEGICARDEGSPSPRSRS
jgi:hypothetical protein